MNKPQRMPAEWEKPREILMAFPNEDTDWNYILPQARVQWLNILSALTLHDTPVTLLIKGGEEEFDRIHAPEGKEIDIKKELITFIGDVEFNDTWTRDYGPITVEGNEGLLQLDFGFNGWGLKFAADRDNLVNLRMAESGHTDMGRYRNHRDFTLEGGSVESDGRGTILTTSHCLLSPNRNGGKTKPEIEKILEERLGARRVLWLDHGFLEGDDTDHHVDTLARLAPDDTIVYVGAPENNSDIHYEELRLMQEELKAFRTAEGRPYRLVELPFPDAVYDDEGNRLPATYANYLVTDRFVFAPVYGQEDNDTRALKALKRAFPSHEIVAVECTVLLWQHGSLHCSTMQLY